MPKTECPHRQPTYMRDVILIIAVILLVLVLREGVAWFFKTNHVQSDIRRIITGLNRAGISV
uniref:Uncharacterized protein n=1 Tax=viral metagenome TaxID=1070528 RepID=A0A6C0CMZ3_9ZZZZ